MSEWLKGYKLITKKRGSIWIHSNEPGYRIYPINKSVKRARYCGPLAVFNNLSNAIDFKISWQLQWKMVELVVCKYKKAKDHKLWQRKWFLGTKEYNNNLLPKGTDFADQVICLE